MSETLVITDVGDAWINSAKTGENYGDTNAVHVKSGERRGLVKPQLPNIAGRTVLDTFLVGHAAAALAGQTITVAPVTERWQPGRVTWNNPSAGGPTVNGGAAVATVIPATDQDEAVTLTGLAAILQAVADGTEWHGLRLATSSAATGQRFRSTESGEPAWELHIELADLVVIPDNLRPDGGAIGDTTPVLAWDPIDNQADVLVQVDTPTGGADPDEVAPDYDSGWQAHVDPEWDLTGEHTLVGAGPHYWRVFVRDADGVESEASDWAEITVVAKPTIVVDSPTGAFGDPELTVAAHLSSGTLSRWRAFITGRDRSDVRVRTGMQTGPIEWTVPLRAPAGVSPIQQVLEAELVKAGRKVIADAFNGWLNIRAWDDVDRVVGVGEKPYAEVWVELIQNENLGVVAPADLTIAPVPGAEAGDPRRVWSWTRTEVPDAWLVRVAGSTVARLTSDDVTLDAGTYSWVDSGQILPLRPHTIAVHALEDGDRSAAATLDVEGHVADGVWLIPDDPDIDPVCLAGTAIGGFARADFRATYTTAQGDEVDVLYGTPGRRGQFTGTVDDRQDVWSALDRITALRESRNRYAQLVWASKSIAVWVRDPDERPAEDILPSNLSHDVSFEFVQVD